MKMIVTILKRTRDRESMKKRKGRKVGKENAFLSILSKRRRENRSAHSRSLSLKVCCLFV